MDKRVRLLGGMESRMAAFHSILSGSTQGIQVITLSDNVNEQLFKESAMVLYKRYQALQCVINEIDGEFYFIQTCDIDDVGVEFTTINRSEEVDLYIREEVNTALDQDKSLWRIRLLKNKDNSTTLIMTVHHALIDGAGMFHLANDLLDIYQTKLSGNTNEKDLAMLGMHPAVDDFQRLKKASTPKNNPAIDSIFPHSKTCSVSLRKTHWECIELSDKDTEKFKLVCSENGLKPHSVIAAILMRSAFKSGLTRSQATLSTATSLRHLVPTDIDADTELGCYISIASTCFDTETRTINESARLYDRELLMTMIKTSQFRAATNQSEIVKQTRTLIDNNEFTGGVGITNLGEVGVKTNYKAFDVIDYLMLANRNSANFALVAHCMEFKSRLKIIFVYPEPSLLNEQVEAVKAKFSATLEKYISSSDNLNQVA
ncbi:MAG: condensation domain-containing protein [Cellvibrionales bacterium]|nr:condensation domain-containing protein [Cellvibrionales bacterium]